MAQPTDVTGCQLWLDAADASTVTVTNGTVTNVMNKGNTSITLSNASGFTYDSTNMAFSNATSSPSFNLGKNSTYTQTQPGTLFTVAAFSSAVSNPHIIDSLSTQIDVGRFMYSILRNAANTANIAYVFAGNLAGPDFGLRTQSDIPPNNRTLHTLLMNSTSSDVRINGITQTWSQNPGTNSMTGITVANRYSGSHSWVGTINEILLFNRGLTLAERQQVEGYLAHKWGLTGYYYDSSIPLTIPGCGIWLDGADTSSMTLSSGAITQWRDKSGSSNHFTPISGTPTSISDNGKTVVNFTAGAIMTSANQISFTTSSAFFIVSKLSGEVVNWGNMLLGFTNINGGDKSIRFVENRLIGTGGFGDDNELANGSYYVNGTFNPSFGSDIYLNVYSLISTIAPQSGGTSSVTLSSSFMDRNFVGNIAEFIFYPGGVSDIQRQTIEGYLTKKWGIGSSSSIPSTHPFKSFPPATVFFSYSLITDNLIVSLDPITYVASSTSWQTVGNIWTLASPATIVPTTKSVALSLTAGQSISDNTGISTGPASTNNFTIEIWFNAPGNSTNNLITEVNGGWNTTMMYLENNTIRAAFWNGGTYSFSMGSYAANTWTQACYTYSGTTVRCYTNGVFVSTDTTTKQYPESRFASYRLSTTGWPIYSNTATIIGGFRIYSTALSAADVKMNYNAYASRFGLSAV